MRLLRESDWALEQALSRDPDAVRWTTIEADLDEEQAGHVRVGRKLPLALDGLTAVFAPDGEFLALYEPAGDAGVARPVAVFTG